MPARAHCPRQTIARNNGCRVAFIYLKRAGKQRFWLAAAGRGSCSPHRYEAMSPAVSGKKFWSLGFIKIDLQGLGWLAWFGTWCVWEMNILSYYLKTEIYFLFLYFHHDCNHNNRWVIHYANFWVLFRNRLMHPT
jgi:hypothetical protein